MSFFNELKRRNVFRMGIAYVVVGWVLLQATDFALDLVSAPNWVMQVFFIAALVGLPIVLIVAWVFEMTPDGIKRESEIDRSESLTQGTGRKLDRTIIIFLAFAVVLLLADRFLKRENHATPAPVVVAEETTNKPGATQDSIRSVAVLPFVNMSSDPEQEYFSDGLAEELLNRLAKNEQLHVAARTSSFQFKGQNRDVGEIGRQLKVDHVLEGSVRKSGNRLRITAQLIQVDSGYHLWSETYEREIDDIFAIQDDISTAITSALEAELGMTHKAEESQPTDSLEAYQLYLRGRFLLAKRGGGNMLKANEFFEQALDLDPEFSKAWSSMAFNSSLLVAYTNRVTAEQMFEKTKNAFSQAIRLNPLDAEAYMAFGRVLAGYARDWKAARKNFEMAFQLGPNNNHVLNLYADFLEIMGEYDRAIELERRALKLDPLSAVHASDLAFKLGITGRSEEAIIFARTSMTLAPDSLDRRDPLVWTLIRLGQFAEARSLIESTSESIKAGSDDRELISYWWAVYFFEKGETENLRDVVMRIIKTINENPDEPSIWWLGNVAFFSWWLDGEAAAIPWLEKAYLARDESLYFSDFFYLPERMSQDPAWLEFWAKPDLQELFDIRKSHPHENIGLWNQRRVQ